MHDETYSGTIYSFQPTFAPKQERLARAHAMTHTVAGRTLKQNRIFDFALSRGSLEDDLVDSVLHSKYASAKLGHCRGKQEMLVLPTGIESLPNLRQGLHPDHIAGLQPQGCARAVLCSRSSHKPPTLE